MLKKFPAVVVCSIIVSACDVPQPQVEKYEFKNFNGFDITITELGNQGIGCAISVEAQVVDGKSHSQNSLNITPKTPDNTSLPMTSVIIPPISAGAKGVTRGWTNMVSCASFNQIYLEFPFGVR